MRDPLTVEIEAAEAAQRRFAEEDAAAAKKARQPAERLQGRIALIQQEIEKVSAESRKAVERHLRYQGQEHETRSRLNAIDSEIRQVVEMAAQWAITNDAEEREADLEVLHRLETTRSDLTRRLPIRVRVAQLTMARCQQLNQELNLLRDQYMQAMTARARLGRLNTDGWVLDGSVRR